MDDRWVEGVPLDKKSQDKLDATASKVQYLTRVTREIAKDLHRNVVRLEGRGVRVREFHEHVKVLTPELCKISN
eukprot:15450794-Alexandrium_andersonii.AAC.1